MGEPNEPPESATGATTRSKLRAFRHLSLTLSLLRKISLYPHVHWIRFLKIPCPHWIQSPICYLSTLDSFYYRDLTQTGAICSS